MVCVQRPQLLWNALQVVAGVASAPEQVANDMPGSGSALAVLALLASLAGQSAQMASVPEQPAALPTMALSPCPPMVARPTMPPAMRLGNTVSIEHSSASTIMLTMQVNVIEALP